MMDASDTIAAIASPPGAAAVAILRCSGPEAHCLGERLLPGLTLASTAGGIRQSCDLRLPDWPAPLRVDVYRMQPPRTYTREPVLEIHMPGALPLVEDALSAILAWGARTAEPGEFTYRAFINGRLDLARAEGVAAMIHARDSRERELAARLMTGEFSRRVLEIRRGILALAAGLELDLDFSDQDIELVTPAEGAKRARGLLDEIAALRRRQADSLRAYEGLRVALIGPANAGKSSLFNRILGRERTVVSEVQGTTRDCVEEAHEWQGVRTRWFDTAGWMETADGLTHRGIARMLDLLPQLDGVCVVLPADASGPRAADFWRQRLPAHLRVAWVVSKADLLGDAAAVPSDWLPVSAVTGRGLIELLHFVNAWADDRRRGSAEYLVSARNDSWLAEAETALRTAAAVLDAGGGHELAALDCREAMSALGRIVGELTTEDILGEIFTNFCIGK